MKTTPALPARIEILEARIAPAFAPVIGLGSLDGSTGFKLSGVTDIDFAGGSVSDAGDVNGDGFADVIIGATGLEGGGSERGGAYVVFGKAGGFSASTVLSALDGSNGFKLDGVADNDRAGSSVSAAGDVNGDGFDDLLIGTSYASEGGTERGAAYVVFGKASGFTASVALSSLNGTNGFKLSGVADNDRAGSSVSAAGDVNGDGFGDVIIGTFLADGGGTKRGAAYVVFGKASGFTASVALSSLNGSNGFTLHGAADGDLAGRAVSGAGDVNGDGFDDLLIGAIGAAGGTTESGAAYVVFGKASAFAATVTLSNLIGSNGFKLSGVADFDGAGSSVSSAGDVNGDGFADLLIGAYGTDQAGEVSGAAYVVFGKAGGFAANVALSALDGSDGFKLSGAAFFDRAGQFASGFGDVNGDGFADLLVGAYGADEGGTDRGAAYVVFGKAGGFTANVALAGLNGSDGFKLRGVNNDDRAGRSVSGAGDVNGDGFADLIIGATGADEGGSIRGAAYVVFGGPDPKPLVLDGSELFPGQPNSLTIQLLAGTPARFEVLFADGTSRSYLAATVSEFLVLGGAGNDSLTLDMANGLITTPVTFHGAGGQDVFTVADSAGEIVHTAYTLGAAGASSTATFDGPSRSVTVTFTGIEGIVDTTSVAVSEVNWNVGPQADVRVAGKSVQVDDSPVLLWFGSLGEMRLNDLGSANTFQIAYTNGSSLLGGIILSAQGGDDTLRVTGAGGRDTFTLTATTLNVDSNLLTPLAPITFSGFAAVEMHGGLGDDTFAIASGGAFDARVLGGPGGDQLSFATSSAAVGFDASLLGSAQTLNGLGWSLTLLDPVESFTGSNFADQITIAPGAAPRSVSDPNGTGTLILDGLGSALTINGLLLNNASGTVTVAGLADPTFTYTNIGEVRTIHVPTAPPTAFGTAGNSFAAPLDFAAGKGASRIAVGDLNGDGRADFVTADAKGGTISIALTTASGLLLPAVQKLSGGVKPSGVVIGDFDGVNGPDIAVTNATTGNVGVFLNNGSGVFGDATVFTTGKTPGVLRAGDLNGDTKLDLATIVSGNKLAVLLGNGDGTFAAATTLATGALKPKDFALGDIDGDTDLDLAVLHTDGRLATHVNDGTANFAAPTIARAGAGATALALADFNNDGKLDAAVTHSSLSRYVAVLLGQGTGAFSPLLRIAYPLAAKASALVASDFDGDGRADLAIANSAGGRVAILRGLGNGGFTRALDLALDDVPPRKLTALALGDLDGDGRTDLVALGTEVSVLLRA